MSETAEKLMDFVEEAVSRFTVEDDQMAEWCLQQIRKAEKDRLFWKNYYDRAYRSVCETCDRTVQDMEARLQGYFDRVPHKKAKESESYPLPSGKLVFKKQEPEYERKDEDIIKFLKKNGGERFVKVTESLDWSGLKKTVTVLGETVADENGEVIPGITAKERDGVFKVELKKEEVNDGSDQD